jgi:acetylornithine deacetylase/succinyl-diaminopimelate desuccinylase
MKGAVAAMAVVLADLATEGRPTAGSVTLAAVMDEEMEGLGVEHLIASGFLSETGVTGAIVGEPTGNQPCLGHKGLEWLEVELVGRSAHGSTPQRGINAIGAAARFVELVRTRLEPRLAGRRHPLLGRPTINFGTVRGGDQPSTVAARCALALDRRSVPGESYASMVAELEELLAEVAAEMPGLVTEVRRFPGGAGALERDPFVTPADDPLAVAVATAYGSVTGREPEFDAFPAWTDGGMLAGAAGIPTVILGPGDLSLAHSPREALPVAELVEAARFYAAAVREFCR